MAKKKPSTYLSDLGCGNPKHGLVHKEWFWFARGVYTLMISLPDHTKRKAPGPSITGTGVFNNRIMKLSEQTSFRDI